MIDQSLANRVMVRVNSVLWPAVSGLRIRSQRSQNENNEVDPATTTYTITVTRYFPVGLEVEDWTPKSDFSMTVIDNWTTYCFFHCEWMDLQRETTDNGVTETAVIVTTQATVS